MQQQKCYPAAGWDFTTVIGENNARIKDFGQHRTS